MKEIAIEGLDGAGKTSVAQELADIYANEGLRAHVAAPYRLAEKKLGADLFPLWRSDRGAEMAIDVIHGALMDTQEEHADADVLIYDRHWMTAFTEIAGRPELVARWGDTFVPTAYLRVDPAVARARAGNDETSPWMEERNFQGYAGRYTALCHEMGEHLLGIYRNDDDVTQAAIAQSIAWDARIRR